MDLKIKDVSELLHVSEKTIRRWLVEGRIPAYLLNHQYRFSRTEVEDWMLSCKINPVEEESLSSRGETQIYPLPECEEEEKEVSHSRSGQQQYSLYRAIHKGDVLSNISGSTKEEVIRATMKVLAPRLGLDAEVLSELLLDREKLMPTALSRGLAVPHARDFLVQGADQIVVVFPKVAIEYGALDGEPVHTLFFLLSSDDKKHLHLLAKLAHLGSNEKARAMLAFKPSKEQLLDYIRQWESSLTSHN